MFHVHHSECQSQDLLLHKLQLNIQEKEKENNKTKRRLL